jgi:hypothetical protein
MGAMPFTGPHRTTPMTVANTGFMLDRLGRDCAPLQFIRELTQNAIEAILARPEQTGEIVWDVDWNYYALTGVYKLCVIDTGVGMTGEEMVRYINQLSSSVHEQSHAGNFGVGAKIAAATRNHAGLVYVSWKHGIGSMIQLWRDPDSGEYGLLQFEHPDGAWNEQGQVEAAVQPSQIDQHGTMVLLLGSDLEHNTMEPPPGTATPSRWVGRYLNTRYFRFPDGIGVRAREGWENPRSDKDRNLLRTVIGQQRYLEQHSQSHGSVPLTNAVAHWWILKDEPALSQNSGWIASSGHSAALYNDELYELATGRGGVARLQQFGVIFGYQRVVLYLEPQQEVESNTARTHLLLRSEPLPWAEWAAEFREAMPAEIQLLMEEVAAGAVSPDHRQTIRERLKRIMELFKLSRYRPNPDGAVTIDESSTTPGGTPRRDPRPRTGSGRSGGPGGRSGNVYALFLTDDGSPADPARNDLDPKVHWISQEKGTRVGGLLEDRAAKYHPEMNLLQINEDFRVFNDMIDRWADRYSHVPGARDVVKEVVHEWFEQQLIETVLGVHALKDSPEWQASQVTSAWSEEALSATVMPRYHIDFAIGRALGSKLGTLKDRVS